MRRLDNDAGLRRNRITIESPTRTADGMGGGTTTWSTFLTVWSKITPVTPRQIDHGEGLETRLTHTVLVRHSDGNTITTKMRVNYGGRIFQIHGIVNVQERNHWIELQCEEGAPS